MSTKKVAGAEATAPATGQETGVESSFPIPILPTTLADVKVLLELKDRNVPNIDIVDTVRTIFPGFDSPLLSKCRNPRTGIMLRPPAVRILREHFKITEARDNHRKPVRKKPHRIQCRVSDATYSLLQRRLAQTGQNVQDYLEGLILRDVKGECNEQVT